MASVCIYWALGTIIIFKQFAALATVLKQRDSLAIIKKLIVTQLFTAKLGISGSNYVS